jgi:hypothetical protein
MKQITRARWTAVVGLLSLGFTGLMSLACGAGQATPASAALNITSSIPEGSSLSQPVAWIATPSNIIGIDHVDFLIDGSVSWTEHKTPYTFNDDGNRLQPWLLSLGSHVLTVRAVTSSGAQASSTAHVTVTTGPQAPAALDLTFTRTVTAADVARVAAYRTAVDAHAGTIPTGVWTAHFEPTGLLNFDDPNGSGGNEAFSATLGGLLNMDGPVNWRESTDRQGGFCAHEVPGQYHWSVAGRTLTITGDDRRCSDRDALFIGTWIQK